MYAWEICRYRVSFLVIILLLQHHLFAQPSAAFIADPLTGCSPIVVQFTDQSTGNPNQWRWDLGNGAISFLQNPSTTYFNPGTYAVKLVVSNAGGSDSVIKNQYITVYPAPVISFTVPDSTGCFPFPVQFTTLSTGTISSWLWDFGDGSTSTESNPLHTYTSAGNFTVSLMVTNNFGCVKMFSKPNYIQVSNGVTAGFTNTNPPQCSAPVTINFTNTSTGPASLIYTWDFGDGSGSNAANPVHTYTNPGSYTVALLAESSDGCRDTIRKVNLISIGTITSQFNSPDSTCEKQAFTITNTTTPAPSAAYWDFGDGTISTEINPLKIYASPGTYTIKLVNTFSGCSDSITRSIIVRQAPSADFSGDLTQSCKTPFTVNFTNLTAGNNTYIWDFGDGTVSTNMNASHTYNTPGNYTVTLIAVNGTGCRDTIVRPGYIRIEEPVITLSDLPQNGCIPITISPTATVVATEPVATYLWNFGDGNTSNSITPVHTYTTAGTYTVSLIIVTTGGCRDTITMSDGVRAGNKPQANFTLSPTSVCAPQPVQFTDISTGNPDQWLWQFGDQVTSTQQNPLHHYQDIGLFSVTLIVWSNTCSDTIRRENVVFVRPPIAKFNLSRNCDDKYTVGFLDASVVPETWYWDFGDGSNSTLQNPSHTYASPGNYVAILTVTNAGCTSYTALPIHIIDEIAGFNATDSVACKNTAIGFTSTNIEASNIASWLWDFGDGNTNTDPLAVSHTYTSPGMYPVSLVITDSLGCKDTAGKNVTIHGPTAGFSVSLPAACLGSGPVIFADNSTTDGIHALVKWVWNFGDGTIDSLLTPPYTHTYTTTGSYNVSLTVADNFGCRDSIAKNAAIVISQPEAGFHSPDTLTCTDKPVSFISSSVGNNLQYLWNFGDGLISNSPNPVHYYPAIGIYTVSLLVTDQYGCRDSITRPAYINISLPRAQFTVSDSFRSCPPMAVTFTHSSLNYTTLRWDFGDGNTSTLANPVHHYTFPGIYFAKLVVTGPGGCRDSMSKRIEVRGPIGSFNYAPLQGCTPLTVLFTATTAGRSSFIWDFSDGTTINTTDSIISHTYNFPGDYTPKMILVDNTGCTVPIVGSDTVSVIGINTKFGFNSSGFCDSANVNFYDSTVSNDLITAWLWDFGDGSTSTSQHPSHHYTSPGIYDVLLIVTTEKSCVDSLILPDTIKVFASPEIAVLGDSAACVPAQLNFTGQVISGDPAQLRWQWNFGNGNISLISAPPPQSYILAGMYTITSAVTDNHGCGDSVSKTINVYPLPNTYAGPDTVVCLGSSIQLNAIGALTYVWEASPGLSCTICPNPFASPADRIMFIVTGSNEHNCTSRDSIIINIQRPFTIQVSPGDSICTGESVQLFASGADQYLWAPATGLNNFNIASPNASPTSSTLYTVIANDSNNCFKDTATVLISVFPIPAVDAGPDKTIWIGSTVQLNATGSPDIISWKWLPTFNLSCNNCTEPVASPRQTTQYLLEVINNGGCMNRDHVTVFVECNKAELFIPNTFSPNGDGMNDLFYPRSRGTIKVRSLMVFNRWGELVFQRLNFDPNDASAGWDGKYKGRLLSPDVFVYTCEIQCENNEILKYKGDITLLQ